MTIKTLDKITEKFLNEYKKSAGMLPQLYKYKQIAWNIFQQRGFPTTKNENWKYFSLKNIIESIHKINFPADYQPKIELNPEYNNIVIVNGIPERSLSNIENSITLRKFSELEELSFVGDIKDIELDSIATLNTAIFTEGIFIKINKTPEKPLRITHILINSEEENLFLTPRIFIEIPKNISATIYEEIITEGNIICNALTEINLGKNASLNLERFYDFPENVVIIYNTSIAQAEKSYSKNITIAKNSGKLRNDYEVLLNGIEAKAELFGYSLAENKALIDHKTKVLHIEPACESFQLYKGIAKDAGTIVFNGNINVIPDAQKTNAFQESHHLLRSYDANVYARPQLEILADDVKCSHGATLGKLDQDAIFYMRSRGIHKELAEQMLLNAFANEIIIHLTDKIFKEKISQEF